MQAFRQDVCVHVRYGVCTVKVVRPVEMISDKVLDKRRRAVLPPNPNSFVIGISLQLAHGDDVIVAQTHTYLLRLDII